MAIIQGIVSLGSSEIIKTDTNPTLGGGVSAPINSLCIAGDGSGMFSKTGAGNTAWTLITGGGGPAPAPVVVKTARLATTVQLPPNTALGSGIGKTLTMNAVGVLTIDGVATVLNDLVLPKNEALLKNNGLYKVTTQGTAVVAAVLTRDITFDEANASEVFTGALITVTQGAVNVGKTFKLITEPPITVDTSDLVFGLADPVLNGILSTSPSFQVPKALIRFFSLAGGSISQTENIVRHPMSGCRVVEVKVSVLNNFLNANTVITLVKNGIDTTTVITVPGLAIGIFKSLITTTFTDDDTATYKIDTTASVSGTFILLNQIVANVSI